MLFPCEAGHMLDQVAQGNFGVSILRYSETRLVAVLDLNLTLFEQRGLN